MNLTNITTTVLSLTTPLISQPYLDKRLDNNEQARDVQYASRIFENHTMAEMLRWKSPKRPFFGIPEHDRTYHFDAYDYDHYNFCKKTPIVSDLKHSCRIEPSFIEALTDKRLIDLGNHLIAHFNPLNNVIAFTLIKKDEQFEIDFVEANKNGKITFASKEDLDSVQQAIENYLKNIAVDTSTASMIAANILSEIQWKPEQFVDIGYRVVARFERASGLIHFYLDGDNFEEIASVTSDGLWVSGSKTDFATITTAINLAKPRSKSGLKVR